MTQRQSNVSEPIPPLYFRILLTLEASLAINMPTEEAKKKLNAKARTAVKQKVKKAIKEKPQDFKQFQEVR